MKVDLGLIYYNLRCSNYSTVVEEATHNLRTCANKSDKHSKLTFWRACANGKYMRRRYFSNTQCFLLCFALLCYLLFLYICL